MAELQFQSENFKSPKVTSDSVNLRCHWLAPPSNPCGPTYDAKPPSTTGDSLKQEI
jgi:hypothetical protein